MKKVRIMVGNLTKRLSTFQSKKHPSLSFVLWTFLEYDLYVIMKEETENGRTFC